MGWVKRTTIRRQTLSVSRVKVNAGIVKNLFPGDKKNPLAFVPGVNQKKDEWIEVLVIVL
jgi:hypothetical protein